MFSIQARAFIAGLAAAAAVAMPATASAASSTSSSCAAQTVSQPFAAYGDTNSYWLAPDGGFEKGAAGWSLSNTKVVTGNESLGILAGTKSLQFGGTGVLGLAQATTPSFCVDPSDPTFRFLVKNSSVASAVATSINFTAPNGATLTVPAKLSVYALGSWSLSESQPLATAIPSVFLQGGTTATITFQVTGAVSAEGLRIDDLMIDPYRRG
ncbi:MAG: hypothetical protein AAGC46_19425 [Solirubrobacteraceae bacterium]|nr:hypothetical protein [Patulibacter sp.]